MRNILSHRLDLLFSEKCVLCGEFLTPDRDWIYPLCRACLEKLPNRAGTLCSVCSTELVSEKHICTRCRERDYSFLSNYSLFVYADEVKELLGRYKTKNGKLLAGYFAARMAPVILEKYRDFTVVPVPFRRSRKRTRGWDQIEAICKELQRGYRLTYERVLLRKGSSAQKSLDYTGRLGNIEGKIRLRKHKQAPEKILLLDDVFTTGATADACAATLLEAGAKEVRMLSIALDQ